MNNVYYVVYKITNKVNGKIYIGVHKTEDLNDGYMGSGKLIKRAIEKHGIEIFEKEYIQIFDNPEDMYSMESELVTEGFVNRDDTYNLKCGGAGGFEYINKTGKNLYGNNGDPEHGGQNLWDFNKIKEKLIAEDRWEDYKLNLSIKMKALYESGEIESYWEGKRHSKETKRKIGEASSKHQSGKGNSQYGTRWIHNLELKVSKKIKKDDPLPEGWLEGRKIKF